MTAPSHTHTGFSLVELSIVLVILGLLTGGILTGQNLIRAAELRSIVTEFQHYQTAVQTFRSTYFALPGDMPNATDFWGAAHDTPATCKTTVGTGTQTCNGDGDGTLSSITGSFENARAWQHLANAGLISGSYTGVRSTPIIAGSETAASKLTNGAWWWGYNYTGLYGKTDILTLELARITVNSWPNQGVISAEEAWGIDTKMDDGRASTGRFMATSSWTSPPSVGTCVDAIETADSANYILDGTDKQACRPVFVKPY
jgi:prepilin-type N-terminal cleavage/methylation domain-containing protein